MFRSLVLLLVTASALAAQGTQVVMLGTGTPNADPERSGPAVAIVVNGESYLVDAGPGIVRRAAAAQRANNIPALAPPKLHRVFLTHLHSDHTTGLPDLMLTPWVLERTAPLEVYGPPRTKRMVDLLADAYADDIKVRLTGGEPSNKTGYRAIAHDVLPGVVYRDSNVTVSAFKVPHGSWEYAYGYVFQTRDRKIVLSGDTGPTDAVINACNGCDVLVHEVYSAEKLKTRTPAWQKYHSAFHTSGYELGDIATRAHAKSVVLYHQLFWGDDDAELIREVSIKYLGPILPGRDLAVY
ncbi:MAG TPA: MBL fold metallo-hydrolase [Gemmatimonadaceae bacterium]|jgi:ribonuclease BN (tRNA processing enzyme)